MQADIGEVLWLHHVVSCYYAKRRKRRPAPAPSAEGKTSRLVKGKCQAMQPGG